MNASGNESVELPSGAVSGYEMYNEPGIAAIAPPDTFDYIDGSLNQILSRTINVPDVGFAVVLATTPLKLTFGEPGNGSFTFGISTSPTSFDRTQWVHVTDALMGYEYTWIVTIHDYFLVTPGTHTFYFLGQRNSGTVHCWAYYPVLTVMYFPTWYGPMVSQASAEGTNSSLSSVLPADFEAVLAERVRLETQSLREEFETRLEAFREEMSGQSTSSAQGANWNR